MMIRNAIESDSAGKKSTLLKIETAFALLDACGINAYQGSM
jgi:hypothetical protein